MNALWLLLGIALGCGTAVLASNHPAWVATHPGTLLLVAAGILAIAYVVVSLRMRAHERGHDERAEAFRLAMIADFAPTTTTETSRVGA